MTLFRSIALLLFIIFPFAVENTSYNYVIRILGLMGLYTLLATGLNFVVGFLGLLDLGFMAFYAVGAYSMALLSTAGVGFWWALLLGTFMTMVLRALLGAPVMRLRGDYLAIVTLGFGEIVRLVLINWDTLTNGPKGISLLTQGQVKPISLFGTVLSSNRDFYFLILFFVVLGLGISARLLNSRIGRAWMATREDLIAARLTGIQVTRIKMVGFIVSAGFAGVAGGIFARWENFVTPESFTFWESVMLVAMVVIGGMGSISGVVLGAALVVVLPEALRNILGADGVSWRYFIFGVILILGAIFRPQGLWPSRRVARELDLKS